MPKQRIYSVHQRSMTTDLERELGVFTDDAMAEQAIDHLYRYAWQDIVSGNTSVLWFPDSLQQDTKGQISDDWTRADRNGPAPVFFKRPHELWNQVPPSAEDFKFRLANVSEGVVPVVEVKRTF